MLTYEERREVSVPGCGAQKIDNANSKLLLVRHRFMIEFGERIQKYAHQ
jgi:hypothetical protein